MIVSAEILDPDGTECHQLPTLAHLLSLGTVASVETVLIYMGKPGVKAHLSLKHNCSYMYTLHASIYF